VTIVLKKNCRKNSVMKGIGASYATSIIMNFSPSDKEIYTNYKKN